MLAAAVAWVAIVIAVTIWAIPVFAQPLGSGLECPPGPCPPRTTVEWFPSMVTGVIVASFLVAAVAGVARLVRRAS
jgi:hypothetical protein